MQIVHIQKSGYTAKYSFKVCSHAVTSDKYIDTFSNHNIKKKEIHQKYLVCCLYLQF